MISASKLRSIVSAAGLILFVFILSPTVALAAGSPGSSGNVWKFKFEDMPICAWLGPNATDAEVKAYKDAGFNCIMVGRYMSKGKYCYPDEVQEQLDLAKKYGLGAFLDTYTQNDLPWGGADPGSVENSHHNASAAEFRWIHNRFGKHPALIGYLLGDDQGSMSPKLLANTDYMRKNCPDLVPWICGWVPGDDLAKGENPIMNPQIYPTLNKELSAVEQMDSYCSQLQSLRISCRKHNLINWPMFNVCDVTGDSIIRFQVYSSLAYGAQGVWYFTYRTFGDDGDAGTLAMNRKRCNTFGELRPFLTKSYYDAKEINRRIQGWGPRLLGTTPEEIYHTGWMPKGDEHLTPGEGKTVVRMSDDLLVGILVKDGQHPLAMVVDKRVSKERDSIKPREVEVQFSDKVKGIGLIEGKSVRKIEGNTVRLVLPAGRGQLLDLWLK